jgi:glycosyltransferase involved in cell wall biosynthesis
MLSVVVITKDEESRIKACLESVSWADEVIVIDNESSDKTKEVAREFTDKVYEIAGDDFSVLRNAGMKKASGDWVLLVDSDERITLQLKEEISQLIASEDRSAYAITRKNIIFGQEVKHGPFWPDWVIRLIKKDDFDTWVGRIHEYPKFNGKLGYTKNSLIHLTHRNLDQIVLKSLEWSKIDARLRLDANHPKMSGWRFLRILFSELFNQGFARKGFFNGTVGVIDSVLQTFSMFMSYVRLWQMQRTKSIEQTYDEIDEKLVKQNFKYP